MKIETVGQDNFESVLPLIRAYQVFYKEEPDDERNRTYFRQYLDDHTRGIVFVAIDDDGTALGFATAYFNGSSLTARTECTFNDLYTVPGTRGKGVGLALAIHTFNHARELGYKKVGWETQKENTKAQRLYDFSQAEKSEWIAYSLTIG